MKKLKLLLILFLGIFFSKVVYANDIKSINMDIYVDNMGDAHITETWSANLNEGTEGYKPYYNLGNSYITDYTVSMNGTKYTTLSSWNVDASFESKKYKAGINEVSNGYELCFGISKYGNNTYTLKYTVTNFVSEVEDAQMIYWQLIPYNLSDKPEYIFIKIYSDFPYADDLDVWGYGNYGGYAYVNSDNHTIELVHEDALDSDEYMTVLVKFPEGTFNTSNKLEHDFNYYYEMAEDGATTYDEKPVNINIFQVLFVLIFNILPYVVVVLVIFKFANRSKYGTKNLKFSKGSKNLKDVPYFRDIPCNKNIFEAYWVACQYNLVKNNTDFLGAILLKWLKNKNIENVLDSDGKSKKALKLISADNLSEIEAELFDMILKASGDGVLEKDEFTLWCKRNYNKILKWFNKAIDDVTNFYVSTGLITEEKKAFGTVYKVNDEMKNKAIQMAGLKKFLNEFSNIKDRGAIEVTLWEEYLMYAQIFGIAKKVAKEFKRLYPEVLTDDYYNDVIFIHYISTSGVQAASAARTRAQSYSSGGGGFSSGGGGGGSFGGGGGGGGFR